MADSLAAFIERARERLEPALEQALPAPPACPPLIAEAMRYSLFAGGKRLRPILALAAADAVARLRRDVLPTAAIEAALPCACALELLHTYSLIHDDLPAMDDDTLRRGRPTLHVIYGDGVAILAGDALQAAAFNVLAQDAGDAVPAERRLRTLRVIAAAAGASGMVGGQTVDLQAAAQVPGHHLTLDRDSLRAMHAMKTGALIRAAAVGGAIMAGATPPAEAAIAEWAGHVGLAFQIVDDILDVEGQSEAIGKTAGKDAARDKPTYPSVFGLAESRTLAANCSAHAHAALVAAGLTDGWLDAIAEWVVTRSN